MQKVSSDLIFDGLNFLAKDTILILNKNNEIIDIINQSNAVDDVLYFNGLICPGFINAHCHLELSHLKNKIPKHTGLPEFIKKVSRIRDTTADEIIQSAINDADNFMYNQGIVAVGDISNKSDSIPKKLNSKIKYITFIELLDIYPNKLNEVFANGEKLYNQLKTNNLLAYLVPHAPYTASKNLLNLLNIQKKSNIISIHNQESVAEDLFIRNRSGDFCEMYEQLNIDTKHFLNTGESSLKSIVPYFSEALNVIFVHNTFIKKEDIRFAKNKIQKPFWCICAKANQYIENTICPINLLINEGTTPVIGTDSLASNDQLSIIEELKIIQVHYPTINTQTLLQWATINGAQSLNIDNEFGRIEKGKKPGLVLIENLGSNNFLTATTIAKRIF